MSRLDFESRYSVAQYPGIAFYLRGYATEMTEESWYFIGSESDDPDDEANYVCDEPEEVVDVARVRAVMVGDDREFVIDVQELTKISEDDYCPECGQIGCKAYG